MLKTSQNKVLNQGTKTATDETLYIYWQQLKGKATHFDTVVL